MGTAIERNSFQHPFRSPDVTFGVSFASNSLKSTATLPKENPHAQQCPSYSIHMAISIVKVERDRLLMVNCLFCNHFLFNTL